MAGTKGADKISTLGTVSKLGEVSKVRESVNLIQRVKNVMDSDKYRQFVDRLNNLLMPKDKFALADANVVDSFSDNDVFKQVKEKLSNYQFFKGEGGSGGKLYDEAGNYTGGRSQAELDVLADDPAHAGSTRQYDIDQGLLERKVGLSLEESGKVKGPITRDPSGKAEFFDANG
ncbi:hypothetical protein ACIGHG_21485 [Bacillus sp. NPDC077411]|uniref:hypothetical protein n=1 Tax=Bacillus sp. NPDC077411 TaxID=3363947 RepID=UPI0037CB2A79